MRLKLKKFVLGILVIMSLALVFGCASTGNKADSGKIASTVATVAKTAPVLARQFDAVYAYLVQQKLVPDHTATATQALAAMDAVAPLVQQGAEALQGDNFNWASFVLQAALITAQTLGYVLPLLA